MNFRHITCLVAVFGVAFDAVAAAGGQWTAGMDDAAGGGALCRAECAAEISATPLLSGGNPDPTVCRVGDEYYIVTSSFRFRRGCPSIVRRTW